MIINSNFKNLVFEQIEKIPYGNTKTYKEVATPQLENLMHTGLLQMLVGKIQYQLLDLAIE